jgi:hypothetical protein
MIEERNMKDISKIPKGPYCYAFLRFEDGKVCTKCCPYWSKREDKPYQENGYCSYLEKGDWEVEIPDDFPNNFPVSCLSLLWDQVKDPNCPVGRKELEKNT